MMQVLCVSERNNSEQIELNNLYWIDSSSIWSDKEDWYVDVYKDKEKQEKIGNLKLSHFVRIA